MFPILCEPHPPISVVGQPSSYTIQPTPPPLLQKPRSELTIFRLAWDIGNLIDTRRLLN